MRAFAKFVWVGLVRVLISASPGWADVVGGDFDVIPAGFCQLKYDFSGAAWVDDSGFEVYVDAGGVFNNTDDLWMPPVIFAPPPIAGSNTEGAGVCDGSGHTVTFIVLPGTIMYIDNLRTVCAEGSATVEPRIWGAIKATYQD